MTGRSIALAWRGSSPRAAEFKLLGAAIRELAASGNGGKAQKSAPAARRA